MSLSILLKQLREENGFTMKELAAKAGISVSTIGEIERGANKSKPETLEKIANALNLSEEKKEELFLSILPPDITEKIRANAKRINFRVEDKRPRVPLYGSASAGNGYLNLNDMVDDEFEIPVSDYSPGRFAVKVEGDSMTRIGGKSIYDGGVALVDPVMCATPQELNNKVCVFTYKGETFIKQLLIDNQNIIQLRSFNPDVPAIIVLNSDELKCEGKVVKTYYNEEWR